MKNYCSVLGIFGHIINQANNNNLSLQDTIICLGYITSQFPAQKEQVSKEDILIRLVKIADHLDACKNFDKADAIDKVLRSFE